MKLSEFVEFAGIVSQHSHRLIETSITDFDSNLQQYSVAIERLLNHFCSVHKALCVETPQSQLAERNARWHQAHSIFVDVFAAGLIVRVWGAVLTAASRRREVVSAERTARGLVNQHDALQQRFLRLMVDGPGFTFERVLALDRLRRQIERWSDLLVGHVIRKYGLIDFAIDVNRALEFGAEQLDAHDGRRPDLVWEMYFVCLRSSFRGVSLTGGAAGKLRIEILRSILGTFPPEMFLDDGRLPSAELASLLNWPPTESPCGGHLPALEWYDQSRSRFRRVDLHSIDHPPFDE